jgi:sarcosine oxidase subunit alpha
MADRRPTAFSFRGRPTSAAPGETLVQTLARRGLPILQRSIRYHRPRAPFCGIGACTQCLVRVNGVPNVRGCRLVPRDGDRVETENAWPSPSWDVFGALDWVFWRGIDTLQGFRRPAWATPLYHRVVRRLAGYGRVPDPTPLDAHPSRPPVTADVVVVGAGTAGRSAAERLVTAGVRPIVVDRDPVPFSVPGADTWAESTAAFMPRPNLAEPHPFSLVVVRRSAGTTLLQSRRVIVATGGYDANLSFPGNDRPGVFTGDGAIALRPPGAPPPFERALLFGGAARAAQLLDSFGSQVEAVVAPGPIDPGVVQRASALDIPLYPRTLLAEARGRRRVRSASLRARGDGRPFSLDIDAIILGHRRLPHGQLFFQAGARMQWRSGTGAYYPELAATAATSVPGLFGAGEAAGFADPESAAASGRLAAELALGAAAPSPPGATRAEEGRGNELEGYYRELLGQRRARSKWVSCACEDVLLTEIEEAVQRGFRGIEVVKRYTGVGTGLCQGRYCLPDALLILSILERRPPAEVGYITQRPPVFPSSLADLASLPEAPADPPESPA